MSTITNGPHCDVVDFELDVMPRVTASVDFPPVPDNILYERALSSVDSAAWSWYIELDSLRLSPYFYQVTGIPENSINNLQDLAPYLTPSSHQQLIEKLRLSTLSSTLLVTDLVIHTNEIIIPVRLCGNVITSERRERIVTGLMIFSDKHHVLSSPSFDPSQNRTLLPYGINDSQRDIQQILDSVRACVWQLDTQGCILQSNQQASLLTLGDSVQERRLVDVLAENFPEVYWGDHSDELEAVVQRGLACIGHLQDIIVGNNVHHYVIDKSPTTNACGDVDGVVVAMLDVTHEAKQELALSSSEQRYQAMLAASHDVIWCFDLDPPVDIHRPHAEQVIAIVESAYLVDCNKHFAKMLGDITPQQLIEAKISFEVMGDYATSLGQFVAEDYQLVDKQSERINPQGNKEYWQVTSLGSVQNGKLLRIWGTSKNITDRKRYLDKLEYQANHDALTQLPNRIMLYNEIERALRTRSANQQMALLIIDLDRFKEINDTLGHHVGDKVLQLLGPRLEVEMEDLPGIVVRLGGDEFAIFLSAIRNPQQVVVFAHRVLDAVQQPFVIEGYHSEIGASIGISICPDQATDVSTLMRYADVAMYKAKKEMLGVSTYHPDADPHSPKRLALMGELGRAIREEQLILHYQPKLKLSDNAVPGFEALLRWQHPEMGMISPGEFIPIAETTGLIHPMTLWVLENSIRQCKTWLQNGLPSIVAVNLSTRNLMDDSIVYTISELLRRYELPPEHLELEITESSIIEDPKRALKALNAIHDLGVKLAIDDFGTGYSSLSYLKKLPVQLLKIDYSFVTNMLEDEQDRIIVHSTINLAHNLGLQVVAEGVETDEALQMLRSMGCDYAQGFFIGRPVPVAAAEEWVKNFHAKGGSSV